MKNNRYLNIIIETYTIVVLVVPVLIVRMHIFFQVGIYINIQDDSLIMLTSLNIYLFFIFVIL